MKKNLLAWLLLLCSSWMLISPVYAGSNGCLTLDGIYSRRLSGVFEHENGLGGSLLLEWQPVESFSFGAGMDTLCYFGVNTPGKTFIESLNLVGRCIFNPGDPCTSYVLVGGGVNPKIDPQTAMLWGGDFHLMGGVGAWYFLSPQVALDTGLVFDYYNNAAPIDPLNALNVRVGLSFFFENPEKKKVAAAPVTASPAPRPQVEEQASTDSVALGRVSGQRMDVPVQEKQGMGAPAAHVPEEMHLYRAGIKAYQEKHYDSAVEYWENFLSRKDPEVKNKYYAEAAAMLGIIYQYYKPVHGHYGYAYKYYQASLKHDPRNSTALKHINQARKLARSREKTWSSHEAMPLRGGEK